MNRQDAKVTWLPLYLFDDTEFDSQSNELWSDEIAKSQTRELEAEVPNSLPNLSLSYVA